jgi:hypothetical protein
VHLVQLLLPLRDNHGNPFPREAVPRVRAELTAHYGGVTAYVRAPASGIWRDELVKVAQDDVVMVEVVVPDLDRAWWSAYRRDLETRFRQSEVLVRALACDRL